MQETGKSSPTKGVFFVIALLVGIASLVLGVIAANRVNADFETANGVEYRWQQFEGKWVVVNYFAKWCAPCLRELPELNRFAKSTGNNIKLFGVNYDPMAAADLAAMIAEFDIQFEVIPNDPENTLPTPTPSYLPATFIISPEGKVAASLFGEQTEAGLIQKIDALKSQSL
ncbi:TlpA family protein disulfide reductase [Alteromonas sp. MYP5]|uniref:TlpA family protein disulfide reductase n=2 Tax=Alteromonas ponticola TaxID=2720613 RepID=A0ABX1R794_9ALTE|nr:TlpA family protein disulfide reductase [Alteromonas ponticola]